MADLNQLSVEELAAMPDWLIPPSRKAEVEAFKARKRRAAAQRTPEEEEQEIVAARLRAGLEADGSRTKRFGSALPESKTGPRGGQYTEDRTKDGRPYRRYF